MRKQISKPTDSELQILQILWNYGPSTVRFVNELLNQEKKVGYTTSLKLMQIMFDKKLVTRTAQGKTHIYTAAVLEKEIKTELTKGFMEKTFKGSALNMVMHALGNRKTSKEELKEIRDFLDKIEKGGENGGS